MIEITLIILVTIVLVIWPTVIAYLALIFLFVQGLAQKFISNLSATVAGVTIFPLDLAYAVAAIYALIYFFKVLFNRQFKVDQTTSTKITAFFVVLYIIFFFGKAVNGLLDNVPLDAIVRLTKVNTQVIYFFLPLVIYKDSEKLRKLLYFAIFLSLVFPFGQPFLIGSEATVRILKGQGTYRLGYGDASIMLALGVLAFFCWERKRTLAFLPLTGIFLLAHRSAFIGIALALMSLAFLRGKKVKDLAMVTIAGLLVIGLMGVVSSFSHVDILGSSMNRASETFKTTTTTNARASVIFIAFEELNNRPLTGLSYREAFDLRSKESVKGSKLPENIRAFDMLHPHNFVLMSIMHHGLLGFSILSILIFRTLSAAYKMSRVEKLNPQGSYLFSALVFFILFALMNNTLEEVGYLFWFLSGTTFWFVNHQLPSDSK